LRGVAPVPFFPPIRLHSRWHQYTDVHHREQIAEMEVYHPRYITIPRVGMALYGLLYFLSILPFMRRLNRVYPFDLLDAHYIYPDGLAAVLLAKALNKPVVLSARGTDINLYIKLPLIRRWILYALRNCDRIIAVSTALKRKMVAAGIDGRKIEVVPNGVDVAKFPAIPRHQARQALGLPGGEGLLLSVGSLRPSKGFQYLMEAVSGINRSHPDLKLKLYIVGYGHYRRKLERDIVRLGLQETVHLVGRVPHHQMHLWYNACDLLCLASETEGWPNVLFEALACGLPVVSTGVGGVPEIIVSPEYGLLLKDETGPALVAQLQDVIPAALNRKWDPQKMMAYAGQHTWEAIARRVVEVFQQTLNGRN
jgi:teichuronic acid biosynthesis glycosyltransferase TuaC